MLKEKEGEKKRESNCSIIKSMTFMSIRFCSCNGYALVININQVVINALVGHNMSHCMRKQSACAKPKAQISCVVTAQLTRAFVFATVIVQSLLISSYQPASGTVQASLCQAWA